MINMLSKKKRDTMLSSAAAGTNPSPEDPPDGSSIVISAETGTTNVFPGVHSMLYNPSARQLTPQNATFIAQRTNTYCYYKGISERYTLLPNDNSVWWHRRIVFSTKRRYAEEDTVTAGSGTLAPAVTGTGITRRKFKDMSSSTGLDGFNVLLTFIQNDVFQGTFNIDWVDPMRAKLNREKITVHSDRMTTLRSGNDVSAPRITKHYTPINKTLVYSDVENGQTMSSSPYTVQSKPGIGNIYILDLFECPVPNDTTASTLNITSQQTVYWHEK